MNKFQRKASRAAKKEQRDLYESYEKKFNIKDLNDCCITKETDNPNFVQVEFTEDGTNFLHAVGTIPSYYKLKKKHTKLLKK